MLNVQDVILQGPPPCRETATGAAKEGLISLTLAVWLRNSRNIQDICCFMMANSGTTTSEPVSLPLALVTVVLPFLLLASSDLRYLRYSAISVSDQSRHSSHLSNKSHFTDLHETHTVCLSILLSLIRLRQEEQLRCPKAEAGLEVKPPENKQSP